MRIGKGWLGVTALAGTVALTCWAQLRRNVAWRHLSTKAGDLELPLLGGAGRRGRGRRFGDFGERLFVRHRRERRFLLTLLVGDTHFRKRWRGRSERARRQTGAA